MAWPELAGATALNRLVRRAATSQLSSFLAEYQRSAETPPELNTTSEVSRAGDVLSVRLTTYVMPGASEQTTHLRFYGGVDGSWAATSAQLVRTGRETGLAKRVAAAIGSHSADLGAPTPGHVLTDLFFKPGGALEVTVDQGVLAPYSSGSPTAALPAGEARPYLSERGRQVAAAYAAAAPLTYATPTVAPSSTGPPNPTTTIPTPSVDCAVAKCIALTYDDGPGPHTLRLLDELAAAGAPATFFMLGRSAQAYPYVVARAASLGMAIGDHTWDHRDLSRLGPTQQRQEVEATRDLLERLTGQPVTLLRPPYGSYGRNVRQLGMPIVLWDVDTEDWRNRSAAITTQRALSGARNGAIILMHDIHPWSVAATPAIIAELRARGYTLVTVPQLLGSTKPGSVYRSGPQRG